MIGNYEVRTSSLDLPDADLDDGRYESVLCFDEGCQINTEHALDVLHVGQAVARHLFRALLVGVETAVCRQTGSELS